MQKNIIKFIAVSELPNEIANFKVHAFTENKSEIVIIIIFLFMVAP